ncbi:MAG: hypothetical protein ACJ763_06925 [Bdellovibrionia bacterium]
MKKLFGKNNVSTSTHSATLPSHRAQVTWSLFVALAVAVVALQQVRGTHRISERAPAMQAQAPQTLVTGKPVPLSQEDLTQTETQLQ